MAVDGELVAKPADTKPRQGAGQSDDDQNHRP